MSTKTKLPACEQLKLDVAALDANRAERDELVAAIPQLHAQRRNRGRTMTLASILKFKGEDLDQRIQLAEARIELVEELFGGDLSTAIQESITKARSEVEDQLRAMRGIGQTLMHADLVKNFDEETAWSVLGDTWLWSRWGRVLGGNDGSTGFIANLLSGPFLPPPHARTPATIALTFRSFANQVLEAIRLLAEFKSNNPELVAGIDAFLAEEAKGNAERAAEARRNAPLPQRTAAVEIGSAPELAMP